ncbi:MAG: hypothetical protein FJ267_09655, partial [Planctomycetes bacterium]|nr:hypothetical protein [Planctomycetota bacterium]
MSRRGGNSPTVALFPFLAVLVCTMGSLIFLLLVTTRQIRDRALAQAEADKPKAIPVIEVSPVDEPLPLPTLDVPELEIPLATDSAESRRLERQQHAEARALRERELEQLLDEWRRKVGRLKSEREEKSHSLSQQQVAYETTVSRVKSLQEELERLEQQLDQLSARLSASTNSTESEAERRRIEKQIAEAQKQLKAAQVALAGGQSSFMVVPFDPQTGTSRRPILIECTADGLRFLPEDIVISPDDLEGFTPRVNPLLAGSKALVDYWSAWNVRQPNPSKEPSPYVLLLVRPDGTVAYYVAMKMLETLQQQHGYELIEADTRIQPPPVDQDARTACKTAVDRLLSERDQVHRMVWGNRGSK